MTYCVTNFKTKKALRVALAAGQQIAVYQPGPYGPDVKDGPCALEGPHYPAPHSWYASCRVQNGCIVPGSLK
jgi:hypothetical protein